MCQVADNGFNRFSVYRSFLVSSFFYRNLKRAYPTVASASGVWVRDTEGTAYLDGCSGAIVANLGHGVTEINQAIADQLSKVAFAHTSQFVSEPGLELAAKLVELAPARFAVGARVYFTSGGSESVETAWKMARAYFLEMGQPDRCLLISRRHSYHGSTLGALSLTGHPARRRPYLPLLKEWPRIVAAYPYRCQCGAGPGPCTSAACTLRCADELEEKILAVGPEKVMAFIGEPIVGAALGAAVPGPEYWRRIREICTKYGVLLIADEVMTGLGRAGANFGLDLFGVEPDIIALGKGLAAGYLPLGAVIASGVIASAFEDNSGVFEHGFTYSGHPVACAAGVAAIKLLNERALVRQVQEREAGFFSRLRELTRYEIVGDVRGRGFLAGLELVKKPATKEPFPTELKVSQLLGQEAAKEGLLIYPGSGSIDGVSGDHVMIAPPFTIADSEMDELFDRLARAFDKVFARIASPT